MRQRATRIVLLLLALLSPAAPASADGPRLADVLARLQALPHEPSFVGLWPARARTKAYPPEFQRRELRSAGGTPLAAVVALHADGAARPGAVLVHGFTESKSQKNLVELATLLYKNGWHVLALDYRGHGESRALSGAPITFGWKEADDVLAAARLLREESKAASVAVLGFSLGGRVAVKAMVKDGGALLQAGMAFGAPIGEPAPLAPPEPNAPLSPIDRVFLGYLGAGSFYEYYGRAASTAGPFVAVLGTAGLAPGKVDVRAWVDAPDAIVQEVTLEKK